MRLSSKKILRKSGEEKEVYHQLIFSDIQVTFTYISQNYSKKWRKIHKSTEFEGIISCKVAHGFLFYII